MKNPKQVITPIPPDAYKKFIAAAKSFNPRIPRELGTYVIEAYVSLRLQDNGGSTQAGNSRFTSYRNNSGGTDQAVMTARQLLSILRLSQALARIRLSNTVNNDDIDEAIRLTHASKASLLDDANNSNVNSEDAISSIYQIMRDYVAQRNISDINYAQIENMVVKKGFTSQQLRACLSEYEQLGVIHLDNDGSVIHFDV